MLTFKYFLLLLLLAAGLSFVDQSSFIITSTAIQNYEIGKQHAKSQLFQEAAFYLHQSYQLHPLKITASDIAECYHLLDRTSDYFKWAEIAANTNADLFNELITMSRGKSIEGDSERALIYASHALQLRPNSTAALYLVANYLQSNGDSIGAIELYRKCIALAPKFVRAQINLAAVYQSVGDVPLAVNIYR
jgi:tetratricopeptide (TPR) repeat protein